MESEQQVQAVEGEAHCLVIHNFRKEDNGSSVEHVY